MNGFAQMERGEPMSDLIDRQAVISEMKKMYDAAEKWLRDANETEIEARAQSCMSTLIEIKLRIEKLPSAEPEIIRCKDCFYGYLYSGVYAGTTCSWVECKKPDGLNRDVSIDGYCSAAIRKPYQQNNH